MRRPFRIALLVLGLLIVAALVFVWSEPFKGPIHLTFVGYTNHPTTGQWAMFSLHNERPDPISYAVIEPMFEYDGEWAHHDFEPLQEDELAHLASNASVIFRVARPIVGEPWCTRVFCIAKPRMMSTRLERCSNYWHARAPLLGRFVDRLRFALFDPPEELIFGPEMAP